MNTFKAIMRHVLRHEVAPEQAQWFAMEGRQRLRRSAKLGIEGRQPAVAAYVKMSKEETYRVAESIVMQKVGSNANNIKRIQGICGKKKQRREEARRRRRTNQDEESASGIKKHSEMEKSIRE